MKNISMDLAVLAKAIGYMEIIEDGRNKHEAARAMAALNRIIDLLKPDTPTLESLLAKVPEGFDAVDIGRRNGHWSCEIMTDEQKDCAYDDNFTEPVAVYKGRATTPALALQTALDRLNTQGEKA